MKKARTLLAIWLALILTLTLFPTALADGENEVPDPTGDTDPTTYTVEWTVDEDQVEVNNKVASVPAGQNYSFSYKAKEGHQITGVNIKVGDTLMRDTVGEPAVDGVYYYTIPKESLNGTVTISISSESVPQNDPEPQATYTVRYTGEGAGVSLSLIHI